MPKVIQINSSCNRGSTGRITEQIGRKAKERGYDCYMAYGRYYQPSELKIIKMGGKWSNGIHGVVSRLLDNHGLMSRRTTKDLVAQLKEIKPDIIHLHNIHGYFLNYKVLFEYLKTTNTPVVWTLHDCWAFTGHCAYFDFAGCDRWKTGCHPTCPCKGKYPQSLLLDASEKNYKLKKKLFTSVDNMTLVPVSEWLGGIVKESFLKEYPVHVIHNGIDTDVFKPAGDSDFMRENYGLKDDRILLGVASIWDERKGLRDYIQLAARLPKNIKIVLIGLSAKQIKTLPANIIGIECTENQKELVQWYTTADIVLNLSYEETFGMTTVEGFGCGTPGIVYNKTASPELAYDDICKVVEAGNIDQLFMAINEMLTLNSVEISKACRERAISEYRMDKTYAEYVDLYDSILKRG